MQDQKCRTKCQGVCENAGPESAGTPRNAGNGEEGHMFVRGKSMFLVVRKHCNAVRPSITPYVTLRYLRTRRNV